jgi:hypothetical protein
MRVRVMGVMAALALVLAAGSAAHAGTDSTQGKKFKLPYAGSIESSGDAFRVANTGSGIGIDGSSSGYAGVYAQNTGSGYGVYGFTGGSGSAIFGQNSGTGSAITGQNSGSGMGVESSSQSSYGVKGETSSGYAGVYGNSTGSNNGVYGHANNNAGSGVYGSNDLFGPGVAGHSSWGDAVIGTGDRNGGGVTGNATGFGNGVTGISASGVGGSFTATGANPAIQVNGGGIQVVGADVDTPTPVFAHEITNQNRCGGNHYTILDNPFLNGNRNAFIFYNSDYGEIVFNYNVGGDCPSNRWTAYRVSDIWYVGQVFTVLVINS